MIVLDASVALKWVLNEDESELAQRALSLSLIAPEFWRIECGNALRKAVAKGEATPAQALDRLQILKDAPVEHVPTDSVLERGLALSMTLRHPIYDCLYLALAMERDCRLLTADVRFRDLVEARSALGPSVVLLSEMFQ